MRVNSSERLKIRIAPAAHLSISVWIKPLSYNNGNPRILQKGDGDNSYRLEISGGNLNFHVEGLGNVRCLYCPRFNEWSHVVATTVDDSQLKLYKQSISCIKWL